MKKTVKDYIRTIPDFPHPGIMFRDVTTLFSDARGFRMAVDQLLHLYTGRRIDKVVVWKRGGSFWAARLRISWRWGSSRSAKRASCRGGPSARPTSWNTARR